jgi:hypothetical protein
MKERVSFYFYLNWKTQIDEMTNEELRRFIDNLISWHQGGEISLPNREDKFIWNGVLPGLEANEKKYVASSGASRENGRLGGRPKKEITQESQQVILEPNKPVNSEMLNGNSKMEIENGEELNVESKWSNGNGQMIIGNSINTNGESISTYLKREIDSCNSILDSEFSNFPFLKSMANPQGIKELYHHLDDEKVLERVKSVLEKLSNFKFKLRGSYD